MAHFSSAKSNLTEGSIRSHLIRLTWPMIWGILAIISFQLIDTYYISLLGTEKLAAISYTFPVTYGIFSIFIGMGVAMSSVVSRLIGEGKTDTVKRITSHGMFIVLLMSILAALIGIPSLHSLFSAMGADTDTVAAIRTYMIPYFLGTFFISMPVVGNAALRASGDAIVPAIIMTIAAVANVILDPLLIFGLYGFPRLELFGAAIATVISNFFAMIAGLIMMHRRGLFDLSHIYNFHGFRDSAKRLLSIGLPVGLTSMLPAFVNSTINGLLSKDGDAAVAAFGTASRVEAFTLVIMMALSIGMAPIIGQNWGAGRFDRVRETVREALIFSVVWSCFVAVVLASLAHSIADIFSDDIDLKNYLVLFFLIVPLSYPLGNLTHGWGSVFNATGRPKISASLLFLKMIVLLVPACFIGHHIAGVTGVFVAIAAVNAVSGAGFHFWAWKKTKPV
ncbi:MAG: MATE family efflux transporter [Alphaproteobacteria bacterium]|jgi:putative MATE family efflux protein|nr:MATE family efflux transporter [Alphaproteobacteria bacterium]MCB9985742.1 MATE family efflux transporter [Micavibrio sp.]HPQ50492.1 MATE family efflux transporter [Alphaproteobacteria bacterium]HRK97626.1 MATE family efflux transporter [Alphaproteobacteria bacterium]